MEKGWIGVDLDGTLAYYDGWVDMTHIGAPIPLMVKRIKDWLKAGQEVKIFTARVSQKYYDENVMVRQAIKIWLVDEAGLPPLEITNVKDFQMIELWDDRAVQVIPNTGKAIGQLYS